MLRPSILSNPLNRQSQCIGTLDLIITAIVQKSSTTMDKICWCSIKHSVIYKNLAKIEKCSDCNNQTFYSLKLK